MSTRFFGTHGIWQGQERVGEAMRAVIARAEGASGARGLRLTGADMLLLALLEDRDGVPVRALAACRVSAGELRAAIGVAGAASDSGAPRPLDDAAREAVILGLNEARRGGFEQAGTGHLLLGLLEAGSGKGVRTLVRRGVRLEVLREAVNELESEEAGRDSVFFGRSFAALLDQIGGAVACPRCAAPLHASFAYCYACGAPTGHNT